jgi:DNA-binding GntR family transcriptional regulator
MFSEMLKPVARRATIQDRVYNDLRASLMKGQFEPGQSMVVQMLADAFETSPMPVREALRRLAAEHALEVLPNGTVRIPLVDVATLEDICRARMPIEGLATELACDSNDPELVATLQKVIDEHDRAIARGNLEKCLDLNQAFHFSLYGAANSSVLLRLIESLWLQYAPYIRLASHVASSSAETDYTGTDFHVKVVEALSRADRAAARAAIEQDIARTSAVVLVALQGVPHEADSSEPA